MKEFTGYQKGMNLGGWLSQCEQSSEHFETFILEKDIQQIADWGYDHIRLPFDYDLVRDADGKDKEEGYRHIDRCITWCEKYNLNIILDLHKTAGFSFDEDSQDFFYKKELQDNFVALWETIARRYAHLSDILSFELLNEVVDEKVANIWNGIAARTIETIRKHSKDIKIIVGGARNNSVLWVEKLDMPHDENIVYTFHFYEPLIFTHQTAQWVPRMTTDFQTEYPNDFKAYVQETKTFLPDEHSDFYQNVCTTRGDREFIKEAFLRAVKVAEERNVAIYCGEFGVIDKAPIDSTLNWIADIGSVFRELKIARAIWTYKELDFGITEEHYRKILSQIIELM